MFLLHFSFLTCRSPLHGRHCRSCCGTYASAQPRSRALGPGRDPRSQRRIQSRGAGHRCGVTSTATRIAASSSGWSTLNERSQAIDFVTLKEELVARRRARRGRRPRVHRVARRRRAASDQRRVLRAHRQGEVDAAEPDLRSEQDPDAMPTRPTRNPTSFSTRPRARSSPSPTTG